MSAFSVLSKIPCGELLQKDGKPLPRPVIIKSTTSVRDASKILAENMIISAPVWDPKDHSFVGFFDYSDLVSLVLKVVDHNAIQNSHLAPPSTLDKFLEHSSVQEISTGLVVELSKKNPFVPVNVMTPVSEILQRLGHGLHRVPLVDDNGAFLGVVSQSDIVRALWNKRASLPKFMSIKAQDVKRCQKEIISVDVDSSVLVALRLMHEKNVSSIALTDESSLVMVLTMTDLKQLFHSDVFSNLHRSAGEYKAELLRAKVDTKDSSPVFAVHSDCTLEHAIGKIVATRCHRVYVVDNHIPIGVVSLTDIMNVVLSSSPQDH